MLPDDRIVSSAECRGKDDESEGKRRGGTDVLYHCGHPKHERTFSEIQVNPRELIRRGDARTLWTDVSGLWTEAWHGMHPGR